MMRQSPYVAALDTDKDGSISAAEMAAAPQTLLAVNQAQGGSTDLVDTLFSFDENKDGTLTKAEVPERMQGIFARADANGDGVLTRDEVTKATAAQGARGPGREGPPDPVLRALDTDRDGVLSAAEISGSAAALQTLDKNGDGVLSPDELRPMMGGMRDPQQMINRMFEENDTNHDGKLSKAEMPERMQEMFARADADQDGFVTKDEMAKAFANMGGRRR